MTQITINAVKTTPTMMPIKHGSSALKYLKLRAREANSPYAKNSNP
jgi:hypothetical protein